MVKLGRPKDTKKSINRRHTILLTEKAELIFRELCKERGTKWIHRYVSEHLIRDFQNGTKGILLHEILQLQKQRDVIEDKLKLKAVEVSKINKAEFEKEAKKVIRQELAKIPECRIPERKEICQQDMQT